MIITHVCTLEEALPVSVMTVLALILFLSKRKTLGLITFIMDYGV